MKKTICIAAAAVFIAVAFSGCRKDPKVDQSEEIKLDIKGTMWDKSTGALSDGVSAGVFAVAGENPLSAERYVDNAEFVSREGLFQGVTPVVFADGGSTVVAYIPYGSISIPQGESTAPVSVKKDQSNISDYTASDLMSASAYVEDGKKGAVSMTMKRLFSKINIELSSGTVSVEDLSNSLVEMTLHTAAVADIAAGTVSDASAKETMVPRGKFKAEGEICKGVTLITVPQSISSDDKFIRLAVNGEQADYSLGDDKVLESGMEYTFSIFVNKVGDRYSLDIKVTEKPWETGLELDFEVDQEVDEIKPVTDIDGNVYEVVKVGAQYWMTSNLIVTKYNDGTPIDYISSDDKWAEVAVSKAGAYCYYKEDDELKAKYGLLYNWHAVDSGKLCPEGWHVPTFAEFMMLVNELGGDQLAGNVMKGTSGWRDYRNEEKPDYQGSNESGFDGRPGGYRTDAGAFLNEGKYGYWWCSSSGDGSNGDAVYLYFNNPSVTKITALYRTGYSVRCIKY